MCTLTNTLTNTATENEIDSRHIASPPDPALQNCAHRRGLGFLLVTLFAILPFLTVTAASAAPKLNLEIIYLEKKTPLPPTLSNLDRPPEDRGLMGARLGIKDSNTTGRFLGFSLTLREIIVGIDENFAERVKKDISGTPPVIVANVPATDLLALSDLPNLKDTIIINAGSMRRDLRQANCRANVLHTIPSRAMLADALMQLLVKKRWSRIFLVEGSREDDKAYADALRQSAKKYRLKIVADKKWKFDADMRRNASAEVPAFTQGPDYDILLIADEARDFGQYILYNTWSARPVGGSHGLSPTAWSRVVEQWGAVQLQNRFLKLAKRSMTSVDFAAWAGVRAAAEAVTRTKSVTAKTLNTYLRGPELKLAIFKGRSSNFRSWNGQMRQSIPLVHPGALVANAPFEGFLHPTSELDTLGFDKPESKCKF